MKHQEGFFRGIRDLRIYYQCWLPETEPKAVILVVHGLAEHSGRYMNLVNHFVPLGYALYAEDHIGHGRSEGDRVYVERFTDYTDTLVTFREMIHCWQKDKPVFLVGHSMGALISALYLLDHQDELSGAVLSGPAVKVQDYVPRSLIIAAKIVSVLLPRLRMAQLDAKAVSRDPLVLQAYESDPLVYRGKLTARLGAEMVTAMQHIGAKSARIRLPILILQGGADLLIHPSAAHMLYEGVASIDKKIIIYEGLYHEVFNEPEQGLVLKDVETWLEARLC